LVRPCPPRSTLFPYTTLFRSVARDMLSFYLFFVLMSFAAYGLVVHDGSAASRHAGRVYMILLVAGDMMLYAAMVLAALDTGGVRSEEHTSELQSREKLVCRLL